MHNRIRKKNYLAPESFQLELLSNFCLDIDGLIYEKIDSMRKLLSIRQ
jgi:hypothetical protein